MDHRQAREVAAVLRARFEPQGWSVVVYVGDEQYAAQLYLDGSVLRASSLVDALNWVIWCER